MLARTLTFRLLNVFTVPGQRLSGNALAVFDDARGLSGAEMQALALQLNLAETSFVLPPERGGSARVRIFTPAIEMPFAGHPTLGTAEVVASSLPSATRVVLELDAGDVEVTATPSGAHRAWTLRPARPPESWEPTATRAELAEMIGLSSEDVADAPRWVDVGVDQLILPLHSAAAVAAAQPSAELLARHARSIKRSEHGAYVWAFDGPHAIVARFFYLERGAALEDPATGSACSNLAGYLLLRDRARPLGFDVAQGAAVGRPSRLRLDVDEQDRIFVGGEVVEVGRGTITL